MRNLMIKLKKNWKSRKKRIKLLLKSLLNHLQKKLKFKNTLTTYLTKKGNTQIFLRDTPQITNIYKNYLKRKSNLIRQCLILRQPLPHWNLNIQILRSISMTFIIRKINSLKMRKKEPRKDFTVLRMKSKQDAKLSLKRSRGKIKWNLHIIKIWTLMS